MRSLLGVLAAILVSHGPLMAASPCLNVNVQCLDAEALKKKCGEHAGACAAQSSCTMWIPEQTCAEYALKANRHYSNAEFSKATACAFSPPDPIPIPTRERIRERAARFSRKMSSCCTLRHEHAHLLDPSHRAHGIWGCAENFAQNEDHACRMNFYASYCANLTETDYDRREQCDNACDQIAERVMVKLWDACMCQSALNGTSGNRMTRAKCDACVTDCQRNKKFLDLLPADCRNQISQWPEFRRNDGCFALSKGAHGCAYYGLKPPGPSRPATDPSSPQKTGGAF